MKRKFALAIDNVIIKEIKTYNVKTKIEQLAIIKIILQ